MVRIKEVKTYREILLCDECGTEMETSGFCFDTLPPIYPYDCPKCHYKLESEIRYPRVVYKEIT
jgi:tRNA(Ile2) C34 agmatinyltransferase TiaS